MANREELLIIRSARAGHSQAQLALGKRYLFGSTNLPQSHATALHWLEKAAEQNQSEAWMLIGEHVSFTVARQAEDPLRVAVWYERAFEGKSARAGLVFAMLVFSCWTRAEDGLRQKSMRALKVAAESGIADAQWLLAQQLGMHELIAAHAPNGVPVAIQQRREHIVEWAAKAARGGIAEAQQALADYWWHQGDLTRFMLWGLPIAQELDRRVHGPMAYRTTLTKQQLALFLRCATAMGLQAETNLRVVERYLKSQPRAATRRHNSPTACGPRALTKTENEYAGFQVSHTTRRRFVGFRKRQKTARQQRGMRYRASISSRNFHAAVSTNHVGVLSSPVSPGTGPHNSN